MGSLGAPTWAMSHAANAPRKIRPNPEVHQISTPILTTTHSLLHASQSGPKRLSFKRAAAMTAFTGSTLISDDFGRRDGWTDEDV